MFYLVVLGILILFSLLEFFPLTKLSRYLLVFIAYVLLVSIAGLRYETGGDWDMYEEYMELVFPIGTALSRLDFNLQTEWGYTILCSVVKQFGGGIQMVFLLVSVFNMTMLVKCLSDYFPRRILMGLMLYYAIFYFALDMMFTRQSVSVMICLYSLRFVKRKSFWRFTLCVFFAIMFHRMSVLFLCLYPLYNVRFSSKSVLLMVALIMAIPLLRIEWIKPLYLFVSKVLGGEYYEKALFYVQSPLFGVSKSFGIGGVILSLTILFFVFLNRKKLDEYPMSNILVNMFILNLFVYFAFYELLELSLRFRYYYFISIIMLLPMIEESVNLVYNKLLVVTFTFLLALTYNKDIFLEGKTAVNYNPYQNYVVYNVLNKQSTGRQRLKKAIHVDHKKRMKTNKEE